MAINYPQWLAFAKYSFQELKWSLYDKPNLRHKYVTDKLDEELNDILASINRDYEFYSKSKCLTSEIITL